MENSEKAEAAISACFELLMAAQESQRPMALNRKRESSSQRNRNSDAEEK